MRNALKNFMRLNLSSAKRDLKPPFPKGGARSAGGSDGVAESNSLVGSLRHCKSPSRLRRQPPLGLFQGHGRLGVDARRKMPGLEMGRFATGGVPVLIFLCAFTLLTGCSMAPEYVQPKMPVPAQLPVSQVNAAVTAQAISEIGWASFYTDPVLKKVIAEALANNRDLKTAALNVETFQAQYRIQRSQLFPSIGADQSWTKQRAYSGGFYGTGQMHSIAVGITSYELDFFGRVRNLNEEALEQYLAQVETHRAAFIALVAETARAWLGLLADRELLAISQDTMNNQNQSFSLVQQRFEGGIANSMELAQARTMVEQVRGSLAQYQLQIEQDRNALNLLAGTVLPEPLASGQRLEDHDLTLPLPANLPSTVLLQRPDIQAAEHALKAANANIGAARAAFFPRISLTSSAGYMAPDIGNLFHSKTGVWAFTPSISVPIFTGGRLQAQLDVAELRKEAAIVNYEKAIQGAFREVADALAAQKWLAERVAAQKAAVAASQKYYDLAVFRYKEGIDSFLTQLDAQRNLFAARQSYVTLRLAQQNNQVNLFKALGGGWKE